MNWLRRALAGMALEGQIGALLGQSIVASGGNALRGLSDLWGAFVVFGVLGILSAWSYQLGCLVAPARGWWISFLGVAALVVVAVITWVFVQREQITLWMAESPETYRWRDIMLESHFAALSVGPIFALAIAYPAWLAWRWWFTRLGGSRTYAGAASTASTDVARAALEDHRTYSRRLAELKRGGPVEAENLGSSSGPHRRGHRRVASNRRQQPAPGRDGVAACRRHWWRDCDQSPV